MSLNTLGKLDITKLSLSMEDGYLEASGGVASVYGNTPASFNNIIVAETLTLTGQSDIIYATSKGLFTSLTSPTGLVGCSVSFSGLVGNTGFPNVETSTNSCFWFQGGTLEFIDSSGVTRDGYLSSYVSGSTMYFVTNTGATEYSVGVDDIIMPNSGVILAGGSVLTTTLDFSSFTLFLDSSSLIISNTSMETSNTYCSTWDYNGKCTVTRIQALGETSIHGLSSGLTTISMTELEEIVSYASTVTSTEISADSSYVPVYVTPNGDYYNLVYGNK